MSFLRHWEIYQVERGGRGPNRGPAPALRLDESPVGYSLASCSPAEPASASPTDGTLQQWRGVLQPAIRRYHETTLTRGLTFGVHPTSAKKNRSNGSQFLCNVSDHRAKATVLMRSLRVAKVVRASFTFRADGARSIFALACSIKISSERNHGQLLWKTLLRE
jgi:hypothetical protein